MRPGLKGTVTSTPPAFAACPTAEHDKVGERDLHPIFGELRDEHAYHLELRLEAEAHDGVHGGLEVLLEARGFAVARLEVQEVPAEPLDLVVQGVVHGIDLRLRDDPDGGKVRCPRSKRACLRMDRPPHRLLELHPVD
jgi:hypothetical protein